MPEPEGPGFDGQELAVVDGGSDRSHRGRGSRCPRWRKTFRRSRISMSGALGMMLPLTHGACRQLSCENFGLNRLGRPGPGRNRALRPASGTSAARSQRRDVLDERDFSSIRAIFRAHARARGRRRRGDPPGARAAPPEGADVVHLRALAAAGDRGDEQGGGRVRRGAPRPELRARHDLGDGGVLPLDELRGEVPGGAGRRHDRVGEHRRSRAGDAARRGRLRAQALGQRSASWRCSAVSTRLPAKAPPVPPRRPRRRPAS